MNTYIVDKKKFDFAFTDSMYMLSDQIKSQIDPYVKYEEIDTLDIFGNNKPLNIEIGIGNGEFITYMASKNKNENYLGFEIVKKVFIKAVKRIKRNNLENVRIIHYDALFFIKLLKDNLINNLFINFPDPWPKRKHHKRRLINQDFIKLIEQKIVPKGYLFIVTDFEDYAENIKNTLEHSLFKSVYNSMYINYLDNYYETKYYRKFGKEKGVFFFKLIIDD
ncbi:MAG: tRNA (guanosine(46)-N7)-methyltransferase TrmB [Deferribacterota bacterium]|nr:tRNA (guanosine(46)-N7)-methyltransferase TrmB [Deferribacterota bacterium]